jgi:lipopolysaccharide transport system ATP-binding protein
MSDLAIRVENLGKQYHIGGPQPNYRTIRETLVDGIRGPFRRLASVVRGQSSAEGNGNIWALKDVSFEVRRGDVLGIIGRNGAGKSTLLKILSGITEPTEGRAELRGRIGSLLEVGTGFHPELTGRENVYLNGAILGMRRAEIDARFDEIVAFAEIERFLDTPVKHYSSGMYVRLAFAVAAYLEPEILLVDEVLAVGDAAFQSKCLGRMDEVAHEGRTVLFVSHNLGAVRSLCTRGLLLASGCLAKDGPPDKVIDLYLRVLAEGVPESGRATWDAADAPGDDCFRLLMVELSAGDLGHASVFSPDMPFEVRIRYQLARAIAGIRVVLQVRSAMGEIAFTSSDHSQRHDAVSPAGRYLSVCRVPGGLMNLGEYVVHLWAGIPGVRYLLEPDDFMRFSVSGVGSHGSTFPDHHKWPGVVCPRLDWSVARES